MRVPIEWLKEYVDVKKPSKDIAAAFTQLGLLLDKPIYEVEGAEILDLEHRMDRSDWLSIIGCARDLAAFEGLELKYPDFYTEPGEKIDKNEKVEIKVECPDIVKRFNTRVFKNVTVKESPDWLRKRLEAYGIPSINNVVDITNYIMVEFGQPMHAQDIDKMEAREIVIRMAKKGESVTTLLGETIELDEETFVLTQAGKPTVIGGVVGGKDTGVDESTKNIVIDAGNYDQINVRRTSRRLKIQNETVLRYDKFLHPHLTQVGIERAAYLIKELAGGKYYENHDYYPEEVPLKQLTVSLERVEKIAGFKFTVRQIRDTLSALGYKILEESAVSVGVEVPYFRTDVEVEDDLVADVLRIYDYEEIPVKAIESAPPKATTPAIYTFEDKLRDLMVNLGGYEHITDPLVSRYENLKNQVVLENALSSEKSALRTSIKQTLTPVLKTYKKHKTPEVGVFEIGRIYSVEGDQSKFESYVEERKLQYIYQNENLSHKEVSLEVKGVLYSLLENLGIAPEIKLQDGVGVVFAKEIEIGKLEINSFELDTVNLMRASDQTRRVRRGLVNSTSEDISLILDGGQEFGPIYSTIKNFDEMITGVEIVEEFTNTEKFGAGKKAVLVRVEFSADNLKTNDVEKVKSALLKTLESEYSVTVRS